MSDLDILKQFDSGKRWKGFIVYQCPKCPFDSIDPGLFSKHVWKHVPKVPKVQSNLLDAKGAPITPLKGDEEVNDNE